jgi:putative PIN family toxin of toxin-antitoxin system
MKVVLDTNVLVSAFLITSCVPARILESWYAFAFTTITSPDLLAELARILTRPRISQRTGLNEPQVAAFVDTFRGTSDVVVPTESLRVVRDDDDNRLLEAAAAGHAHFIVTGDQVLLVLGTYGETRIVTPAAFLAVLRDIVPEPEG